MYFLFFEVLQRGSFGGTYFRDIKSSVTGKKHKGKDVIKAFPKDWFDGLNLKTQVCSKVVTSGHFWKQNLSLSMTLP